MMRSKAEEAIASHPEWGIEIGPDGPWLIEGFVLPSVMEIPEPDNAVAQQSVIVSSVAEVLQQSPTYPSEQQGDDAQRELWDAQTYAAG